MFRWIYTSQVLLLLLMLMLYLLRIDSYPDRTGREPFQNLTIQLLVAATHVFLYTSQLPLLLLLLLLLLHLLRSVPYPDRTDREPFQNLTIELFVAAAHVLLDIHITSPTATYC